MAIRFYNSKICIPNRSVSLFEDMIFVWEKGYPTYRERASEVFTDLSFVKSYYENHKNFPRSNKLLVEWPKSYTSTPVPAVVEQSQALDNANADIA